MKTKGSKKVDTLKKFTKYENIIQNVEKLIGSFIKTYREFSLYVFTINVLRQLSADEHETKKAPR